jgi:hypothetical protein
VIDLSGLYANAPGNQVPAFGVTAYTGPGEDTIIDGRARDFFAGGSGRLTIQETLLARIDFDQVLWPNGVNVNVINRALAFPTCNHSVYANADPLWCRVGLLPRISAVVNGLTDGALPPIAWVTVPPGTVAPDPPIIALLDDTGIYNYDWVTANNHPRFGVYYQLLNSATIPPTLFATGQPGTNANLYMNGKPYTQETLADGTYAVTGTITDFWGNTSGLATAPKQLVVDTKAPTGDYTTVGPTSTSRSVTLNFAFNGTGTPMAWFRISVDGGAMFTEYAYYTTQFQVNLWGPNGVYTIVLQVFDLAGNMLTVTHQVLLNYAGLLGLLAAPVSAPATTLRAAPAVSSSRTAAAPSTAVKKSAAKPKAKPRHRAKKPSRHQRHRHAV